MTTWHDTLEHLRQSERIRQRTLATAAVAVFLCGFVVAAGFGLALLALLVIAGSIAAGYAVAAALMRHRPRLQLPRLGSTGVDVRRRLRVGAAAVRGAVARARVWIRPRRGSASAEPRARALQLNIRGAALRREGEPTAAIEQHEQALELVRDAGDRELEAPTLNSLGLALAAAGDTDSAVERFEESLEILRELTDDDQEGKVIANLGVTLLRSGEDERARELLATALEKLPAESPAAQRVEVELRRAS